MSQLGDLSRAGRPGIGVVFTISRTQESYWPFWLVTLAGECPKVRNWTVSNSLGARYFGRRVLKVKIFDSPTFRATLVKIPPAPIVAASYGR